MHGSSRVCYAWVAEFCNCFPRQRQAQALFLLATAAAKVTDSNEAVARNWVACVWNIWYAFTIGHLHPHRIQSRCRIVLEIADSSRVSYAAFL